MGLSVLTHARLMQESELRVEQAARTGTSRQRLVASRVIESARAWQAWETEHCSLMRRVAAERRPAGQSRVLRLTAFALIHRKALFEYLSERQLTGEARRRLISTFHESRAYIDAMVGEHTTYVRSSCSFLCTSYLGGEVLLDGIFQQPMDRYEALYQEYFRGYCNAALASADDPEAEAERALLPYLKHQATELRQAILALPRSAPDLLREIQIRTPTGTTQKIPRLKRDR